MQKQYWHLISVRALYGVFAGLYYAPSTALISEVYKEKKGSALGVFMIGPPVGSTIAPAIVVPIALALEWRYSFVIISLVSALIGIALIHGVKGEVRQVEGVNFAIPKNVFGLSLMNFIVLAAFFGMLTFLPDFFVDKGRSIEEASFYFSLLSIAFNSSKVLLKLFGGCSLTFIYSLKFLKGFDQKELLAKAFYSISGCI